MILSSEAAVEEEEEPDLPFSFNHPCSPTAVVTTRTYFRIKLSLIISGRLESGDFASKLADLSDSIHMGMARIWLCWLYNVGRLIDDDYCVIIKVTYYRDPWERTEIRTQRTTIATLFLNRSDLTLICLTRNF